MRLRFFAVGILLAGSFFFSSCAKTSYPGDRLKEDIAKICLDEYGIESVDVKVVDTTIGVYLPLKKLFAADFKDALISGKVRNIESLLEPHPEALEKIEDVLFAISRVLLSTDKKLEFYTLQAVDVEKTGMQLVLSGYVDDIKRVRVWDISRDEYRKRIVHEIQPNRIAKWHQPVRQFFRDLSALSDQDIQAAYFGTNLAMASIRSLFFNLLSDAKSPPTFKTRWEVLTMKSIPVQKNQVLVYTKIKPIIASSQSDQTAPQIPEFLEYLFLMSAVQDKVQILRIIPFQYLDAQGALQRVPFPPELQIEQNLEQWEEEFDIAPVHLGDFLAEQASRRVQAWIAQDERMANTFHEIKEEFRYIKQEGEAAPYFQFQIQATLAELNHYSRDSLVYHEDMQYFIREAIKEFLKVTRSYQFESFEGLKLKIEGESQEWNFSNTQLEQFRKNKIDLTGLFRLLPASS